MTKVEAIKKLLEDNGGIATWSIIYNEIEKYYPKAKISSTWQSGIRGVLYREIKNNRNFKKIEEGTFSVLDYDENNLTLPEEYLKEKITTKNVLTKIRIGQAQFRKELILNLKRCPITKIDDTRILNASHIKPWVMANNQERLDVKNGLLLSPTFDKLFDRGFISFSNDKEILISPTVNSKNIERLHIYSKQRFENLPIRGREEYLEYHRKKIFLHA
ncbi:HNH endonuclease [Candidatus Parcubacteria bacterium]|nr:HNH endonuclease [Candidatus Parcubacteria bacterium]